jgi:hypothetical protein
MKHYKRLTGLRRKLVLGSIIALPIVGAGGVAYAVTLPSSQSTPPASVTHPAVNGSAAATPSQVAASNSTTDIADTPGAQGATEAPETAVAPETDGPGGHQDPNGVQVDHQFQGQE